MKNAMALAHCGVRHMDVTMGSRSLPLLVLGGARQAAAAALGGRHGVLAGTLEDHAPPPSSAETAGPQGRRNPTLPHRRWREITFFFSFSAPIVEATYNPYARRWPANGDRPAGSSGCFIECHVLKFPGETCSPPHPSWRNPRPQPLGEIIVQVPPGSAQGGREEKRDTSARSSLSASSKHRGTT